MSAVFAWEVVRGVEKKQRISDCRIARWGGLLHGGRPLSEDLVFPPLPFLFQSFVIVKTLGGVAVMNG